MTTTTSHHSHNSHHFTDTTLIELTIVKAKPECIWHLLTQAENLKKLVEKSGVKVLGLWMTTAGATHELVTLVQHTSCATRATYKDFRMTDPEWVQFDCTFAKYYTEVENFVCKTSVNFPTLKTINTTGKYLIQMNRYKGFLPFDSKKFTEMTLEMERTEGENSCPLVGVLIPMMSKYQCIICIREFPTDGGRADRAINSYLDFVMDSKNWMNLHDTAQHIVRERSFLVREIPFEKVRANACLE